MSFKFTSLRKRLKKFETAIFENDAPPCTALNCQMIDECASKKLACDAFYIYVFSGRRLSPHIKIKSPAGKKIKVKFTPYITPTRQGYDKIYNRKIVIDP